MKQSIARVAMVVWVVGMLLSSLLLSLPPGRLLIFLGLGLIAVVPSACGVGRLRTFGIVAVAASLVLAFVEYAAGLRLQAWKERARQTTTGIQSTNAPAK